MINILFAAPPEQFELYAAPLRQSLAQRGIQANVTMDYPPADIDYVVYSPSSTLQDFTPYTHCKAVLSLWAGVEKIVGNESLTQPLCRMVDSGLRQGMVEWVVGHTLRYHLGIDQHIINPDRSWREIHPPLARDRPVTILGLGALGQACAVALTALNFPVSGWSRRSKHIHGITCHHGSDGLQAALQSAEILILLLPDTPETEHVINAQTLMQMPRGATIINPGRGPLIDDAALLSALEQGHISAACLDVFRVEPLPQDHPYWQLPNVTVTPHIASGTRPATAAEVLVENIVRGENGAPFLHLVDRTAGY